MNEASDAYKVLAVSYVKPNRKSPFLSLRRGALTYDLVSCQEYFFFGPPPKPILFWLFGVAFFVYFFVVVTFVGVSRSVKKTTTPSGIGKRECCHFLGDLRSSKRGLLNTTLGKISSKCDNFFAGNSTSTSSIENHGNRIGCLLSYWVLRICLNLIPNDKY